MRPPFPTLILAITLSASVAGAATPPPTTLTGPSPDPARPGISPASCICDCLVGYAAPILSVTRLAGATGLLLGGRGGAVLRRHFVLGGAGFTLANDVTMPSSAQLGPGSHNIRLGMGGFWLAYIFAPEALVHPTVGVLLGGGSIGYQVTDLATGAPATYTSSAFYLAQPEVEADINVTRFMRIGAAVYYRFVVGVKLEDKLTNGDAGGPGALLAVKFGYY